MTNTLENKMTNILENICTDLTQSKKLKELGIEADTYFYWEFYDVDEESEEIWNLIPSEHSTPYDTSAYTLEQILNMLPLRIIHPNDGLQYTKDLDLECREVWYSRDNGSNNRHVVCEADENLSTTAARLLIKLKEEGLV